VARRLGLQVRDIVLLPIGGASEIEDLGDDPQREVTVAIVGPITSFALAAVLAAGLTVTGVGVGAPALAGGTFATRAVWLNVALGAFNLVPALPMDGGRVLRGALARRIGLAEATRTAARIGRRLAIAMGIVGFVWMPWLCVIALFVYVAGRAEEANALVHAKLAGLRVRDVMTPIADPTGHLATVVVHEDDPLAGAVAEIAGAHDDIGTVVDAGEHVRGVLLLRRVAELLRD
jgi:hypothetical protein